MGIWRTYWSFERAAAQSLFADLLYIEGVLAEEVGQACGEVRANESRKQALVAMSLDPDDGELWSGLLRPDPADFGLERAAADRIAVLLAGITEPVNESPLSYRFLEPVLTDAGWTSADVLLCLQGLPLATFLEALGMGSPSLVAAVRHHLPGRWLDADNRVALAGRLPTGSMLADVAANAAGRIAVATGRDEADLATAIRLAIGALREALLNRVETHVLWFCPE